MGGDIISLGIFIVLIFHQDTIQNVPLFNEMLFLLIIISLVILLRQLHVENKKIKSGERIKIKKQLDNLSLILSILLGIVMMGFVHSTNNMILLEKVNYTILGLILIISGLANRKSLIFVKSKNSNVEVLESEIEINSADIDLTFSKFQIALKKENGEIEHLKALVLNFREAKRIVNWVESTLNNTSLHYYWRSDDQVKKIKTDTNKVWIF